MADEHSTSTPPAGQLSTGNVAAGTTGKVSTGTAVPPAGGEHGFPPFQKDTFASQLLWLAITFGLLYLIASRIALPRVGGIIADRRARIDGDLAEAARMKGDADAAISSYEKSLADARGRAQAIAAETRGRVAAETEARRKEVEAGLQARLAAAEETVQATRTAAMANVHGIATDAAMAIVARLTGKAPTEDAAALAVKKALDR